MLQNVFEATLRVLRNFKKNAVEEVKEWNFSSLYREFYNTEDFTHYGTCKFLFC